MTEGMQTTDRRVLIVDDEPDIIKAVAMRLRWAGYDVLTAPDGATATQVAIKEQPDVIILDIGLPAGDGHTVAKRLNDNLKTMSIPVIYLTARDSPVDRDRASELGAFDYVTKPFEPERLLATVGRVLEGSRAVAR